MHHMNFEGVVGYLTYETAQKRGEQIAHLVEGAIEARWVVIALPNGRFTPCFINPENPGWFAHQRNICVVN